jgi:CO/xanthine dehydrogenase FAD-binding subunit
MKPVAFEYCRPDTVEEALDLLSEFGGDAAIMSGGLSLGAMLNMRLVRPKALIDINELDELAVIEEGDAVILTGSLVRQAGAMNTPVLMSGVPLLEQAMPYVGHYQTRSRGTLGGSVAHADPSAEIPLLLVTLGGTVNLQSPRGLREVAAREFFLGLLTTDRRADEMITGMKWPVRRAKTGYAFEEIAQRHGDFAIAAVAVEATVCGDGNIVNLSLGMGGIEDRPYVAETQEFLGKPATETMATEIANTVAEAADPMVDLQANVDYRRQLVRVLGSRTLLAAFGEAIKQEEPA